VITISQPLLDLCTRATLSGGCVIVDRAAHTFVAVSGAWTLPSTTTGRTIEPAAFALLQHGTAAWDGRFASAAGAWYWLVASTGNAVLCEPTDPPPPPPP